MKPLQLQISGLNSFREKTTVDFERLLQDGLFGIFGPTGSGKSTILDAITLALYGKVRRAPGGMGGIINMSEQRCSVGLTFEVGYNGSRQRYTVERLFGRNKAGGIETKKARISEHRDGVQIPITEKKNELKEKVEEIIGINVDDFLRAVVLPQGAFAEFLGLEPRERNAVLQRLFGLHQYGDRITTLLKGRQEELTRGRAEIEGRLAELRSYDDDAVAAASGSVDELAASAARLQAIHEDARRRHEEAALLYAQVAEYQELMRSEESRRIEERRLADLRERIALAERCALVRPAIDAVDAARQRKLATDERHRQLCDEHRAAELLLASARERLAHAGREYPDRFNTICTELGRLEKIRGTHEELRIRQRELREIDGRLAALAAEHEEKSRAYDTMQSGLKKVDAELARLEAEAERGNVSAADRDLLRRLSVAAEGLRGHAKEIEQREAEAAVLAGSVELLAARFGDADEKERNAAATLEGLRARAEKMKGEIEAAAAERETLMTEGRELARVLAEIEIVERSVADDKRELRQAGDELEGQRKTLARIRLNRKEAASFEAIALRERDEVRDLREETYRGHALAALRSHLHDDEPCPLCGSEHHPAPHRPDRNAIRELAAIEGELARAESRLREAELKTRDIEREIAVTESCLETSRQRMEMLKRRIIVGGVAVVRQLTGLSHPCATSADLRAKIGAVGEREREAKERADAGQGALQTLEKEIDRAGVTHRDYAQHRAGVDAELRGERARHGQILAQIEELRARRERDRSAFELLARGSSVEEVEERIEELRRRDTEAEGRSRELARMKEIRQRGEHAAEGAGRELEEARRARDLAEMQRRMVDEIITAQSAELLAMAAEVIPGESEFAGVAAIIEERAAERDRIQRSYEEARAAHDDAHTAARVVGGRMESVGDELRRDDEAHQQAERICEELLRRYGFSSPGDALAGELPAGALEGLRADADAIARELDTARHRLEELQGDIAGRAITSEELAAVESEAAAAKLAAEEGTLALGGAREKLRECREKNAEWRRMSQRELESAGTLATMDQLSRYLRANGFVDYLANERLVEICRHASRQLEELTGGRLEIGARQKDGFYIRDYGNGGAERSPSSLSGGETFLVSLSLALALSDTIQLGRAPLEFFFLDEGFGTLDGDLLETVMGSLDRIRSTQRSIGVISHVTQLREWIPRRLIVSPADQERGSRIRYEVA